MPSEDQVVDPGGHSIASLLGKAREWLGSASSTGLPPGQRRFKFGSTVICEEDPPWDTSAVDRNGSIAIPQFRDMQMGGQKHGESFWENSAELRLSIWGLVKLSEKENLPQETLFSSSGRGRQFALIPEPRSPIPLQWAHFSPKAIPTDLADKPCTELGVDQLLTMLNDVLGTSYQLKKRGLRDVLESLISTCPDFGQVYGILRGRWKDDFTKLLPRLAEAQEKDEKLRKDAVRDGYIADARVPRRRIWDLYSNRVLPFHAIPPSAHPMMTRERVTVSHSWVAGDALTQVSTPINGHEWPVPMPRATTLEHVRVELLNLGAEYAWLDILCLRQRGRDEDEDTRKGEWKIDVPTIGNIYGGELCLAYFNGLGLPLDPSPSTIASDRHWLNRVWTVQEATIYWLPGGLTGTFSDDTRAFFQLLLAHMPRGPRAETGRWPYAVQAIRGRACTTELDRVHGVAYSMFPGTLPVYDEGMAPKDAWTVLLKHVHPSARIELALRHMMTRPHDLALLPSWDDFLAEDVKLPSYDAAWPRLSTLGEDSLGTAASGTFFQKEGNSLGPVYVVRQLQGDSSSEATLELEDTTSGRPHYTITCQIGGELVESTPYLIVKCSREIWLVAEVVGERHIGNQNAFEVVKRGSLYFADGSPKLPERYGAQIVYLPGAHAST
ncbi:hypothetical protein PsYK624_137780 [Phanerochaete sordida]|uniref:Heterokaryon incompatibility domain-containing protein n=1 Tax=Phanerochaete sordida TaxID=48140 RepID=A0A9P3LKS8_9APHY|nr:hypothetical protein PsYK624_137780 [Phanerochaete sordida]